MSSKWREEVEKIHKRREYSRELTDSKLSRRTIEKICKDFVELEIDPIIKHEKFNNCTSKLTEITNENNWVLRGVEKKSDYMDMAKRVCSDKWENITDERQRYAIINRCVQDFNEEFIQKYIGDTSMSDDFFKLIHPDLEKQMEPEFKKKLEDVLTIYLIGKKYKRIAPWTELKKNPFLDKIFEKYITDRNLDKFFFQFNIGDNLFNINLRKILQ